MAALFEIQINRSIMGESLIFFLIGLCVQLIESRVSTLNTAVEVSTGLDLVCFVLP